MPFFDLLKHVWLNWHRDRLETVEFETQPVSSLRQENLELKRVWLNWHRDRPETVEFETQPESSLRQENLESFIAAALLSVLRSRWPDDK
jgi:hypothetical protein